MVVKTPGMLGAILTKGVGLPLTVIGKTLVLTCMDFHDITVL